MANIRTTEIQYLIVAIETYKEYQQIEIKKNLYISQFPWHSKNSFGKVKVTVCFYDDAALHEQLSYFGSEMT